MEAAERNLKYIVDGEDYMVQLQNYRSETGYVYSI